MTRNHKETATVQVRLRVVMPVQEQVIPDIMLKTVCKTTNPKSLHPLHTMGSMDLTLELCSYNEWDKPQAYSLIGTVT